MANVVVHGTHDVMHNNTHHDMKTAYRTSSQETHSNKNIARQTFLSYLFIYFYIFYSLYLLESMRASVSLVS